MIGNKNFQYAIDLLADMLQPSEVSPDNQAIKIVALQRRTSVGSVITRVKQIHDARHVSNGMKDLFS